MHLSTYRTFCEQHTIPLVSKETEKFLNTIVEEYRPQSILEIGTAYGYSSILFAQQLRSWGGIVYTFEISYPSYIQCLRAIKQFSCQNILSYFFDFSSISLSKIITQKIDMIFIDAQKSQYLNYFKKIRDIIADNGIIILDDIVKYQNKTLPLYEYLEKNQINYEIFEMEDGDGVMIIHAKDFVSNCFDVIY